VKKCEKFGKNAKNVCEIAKNSIVLVNFVCVLVTFYRKEKSSQKKSDFSRRWYEICAGGVAISRWSLVAGELNDACGT
jgi:hypothetical protein